MRIKLALLACLIVLAAVIQSATRPETADAAHLSGMAITALDMDPFASPANSSNTRGTRQTCARISENDIQDANEDVVDGVTIDITAHLIPESNPAEGYSYTITYPATELTVVAQEWDDPALNTLFRVPGDGSNTSDPLPDNNRDNQWTARVSGPAPAESGDGVLDRITIVTERRATSGVYVLTISNAFHIDSNGLVQPPDDVYSAAIEINTTSSCGGFEESHPDLVIKPEGGIYLPYQPAPAVLLVPFVAIWGTSIDQWLFSMIVGAINVALFWWILRLMNVSRTTKLLLIPFFAFGTVNFYSATTGTLWFFNHVVGVMFLLLAIAFMLRRSSPLIVAIFLGAAFMSRQPMVLAAPFFVYWYLAQRHPRVLRLAWLNDRQTLFRVGLFWAALVPFGLISLWYNEARFGGMFDTGLDEIYDKYSACCYSLYLDRFPGGERFAEFDLKNVPLHLYTILLLPPTFVDDGSLLRPSEFGMSVLLTSPPFVYAALVRRADALKTASWIAVPIVAIPTLTYYSQGWVQFGYRYLMDYIPFLLILTAMGFEDRRSRTSFRIMLLLVMISVVVGFWGRYWGTRLEW